MHPLRNAVLLGGLALLGLPVANAAELIISEYVEGSGNNKALEFYNSGSQVLDLSAYRVEFYFNGASAAGRSIDLSGSLAPGKTFVLANGVADPALLALASQRVEGSWFNGNDAVLLRRRGGEILDSLGQVGFNPGTTWGSGDVQTLDRSLVRKAGIRDGDSDPSDAFDPAAQWLGYPRDTFANLGQHGAGEPGGGEEAGLRPIHEVQGAGAESPLVNQRVAIEGVVVGDFQNASELKGFYVQQEDATVDGDPATSEGIFVYDGGNGSDVKLGDRVRVTGQVLEFNGLTELVGPLQVSVLASGVALPTPAGISLPLASADALERYEGMRVQLRQTLTVNEVYNLGRYGEVLLSSGGRQMTPTNVVAPGEQAKAMQARNDLDRILLDDGRSGQNPDPIRYPAPELSAYNSLRVGDRTSAIDGVLDYSAGSYRIQPLQTPTFEAANPRPAQPAVEGRLRVASFNVLNYFNGDGKGGGFHLARSQHGRGVPTAESEDRRGDPRLEGGHRRPDGDRERRLRRVQRHRRPGQRPQRQPTPGPALCLRQPEPGEAGQRRNCRGADLSRRQGPHLSIRGGARQFGEPGVRRHPQPSDPGPDLPGDQWRRTPDHRGEPPEVEGLGLRRRPGHRRRPGQLQPDLGARRPGPGGLAGGRSDGRQGA